MLTTLAQQDINMNLSLSLCDVQMAADWSQPGHNQLKNTPFLYV